MKPPRRPGRKLTPQEAEVWAQIARTVTPLENTPRPEPATEEIESRSPAPAPPPARKPKGRIPPPLPPKGAPPKAVSGPSHHLDGSWEKRFARGTLAPDFTLDLHGATLDGAYSRLMHGLAQAKAMGARVVLVVTGRPRPVDAMDRGQMRGAIRAKIDDWLAASEHAADIVAVRGAHRRHGGQGAIYVILRKRR
jgi:DNA-nicking Smr family endonuclease